ncbi:MAG: PAS domain S-box protein [Gammaproteobacteria bacterium]|nr:PAS domain S-box protein [Gammaproteobacteria bacterium]
MKPRARNGRHGDPGNRSHLTVPLVYAAVAGPYLVISTWLTARAMGYPGAVLEVELAKGLGFVVVTAVVIGLVLQRMNQAARDRDVRFHDLVEHLPDAVFLLELPARRIRFANAAACEMFARQRTEIEGHDSSRLHVDAEHEAEFHRVSRRDLDVGRPFHGRFHMRRADGTVFPTLHMVTEYEEAGRTWSLSIVHDEARFRAAETRAMEGEQRLRDIAAQLREVFWISSPDKRTLHYVSPAYERVWGRPVAELYADPMIFLDPIVPEDRGEVETAPGQPVASSSTTSSSSGIRRDDGEIRWIRDRSVPVRDESGNVVRVVGIAEDITDEKQRDAELLQARKIEAVGRLTGEIAHDFNNLLTVILGYAESLAESATAGSEQEEDARTIVHTAERGATLTQRLLAFARRQDLQIETLDLDRKIRGLCEGMLDRTLGDRIGIELDLADGLPEIRLDPSQLESLIVNLAINALVDAHAPRAEPSAVPGPACAPNPPSPAPRAAGSS